MIDLEKNEDPSCWDIFKHCMEFDFPFLNSIAFGLSFPIFVIGYLNNEFQCFYNYAIGFLSFEPIMFVIAFMKSAKDVLDKHKKLGKF